MAHEPGLFFKDVSEYVKFSYWLRLLMPFGKSTFNVHQYPKRRRDMRPHLGSFCDIC